MLVVDDDQQTRETYRDIFEWAGFSVLETDNGKEALRVVHEFHPQVVFTGIDMPGMDGFALLERLRNLPEAPKVIINSHNDREVDRARASKIHVDGYFVRGFTAPKNVVNHIHRILGVPVENAPRVLVVDDDRSTRETYRSILSWAGFEVYESHNGMDALNKIESLHPDVIFTGVVMPQMGGFELVQNIRKLATKQPFVLINSHTDNENDRRAAASLGVDGFFVRGFSSPRNVVKLINRLVYDYVAPEVDPEDEIVSKVKVGNNIFRFTRETRRLAIALIIAFTLLILVFIF